MNLQNTTKTKSFLTGLFSFILFLSAACFNSAVEVSGSAFPAGSCLAPLSIESSSPVIRVLTLFTAMDSKRKQDEVWRGKFPEHDYAPLYDGQRLTQSCMELLQAISAQKGDEEVFNILRDPRRRWEFFMAVDHIALFRTREEEMSRLDNMPNFSVEYLL
ncbi:MAG: hypothetical protein JW774_07660, partial [Candidatus Aureabacteria bacterium]|nr:hypothetical protein [Candidatus Auribacterota bacterium]